MAHCRLVGQGHRASLVAPCSVDQCREAAPFLCGGSMLVWWLHAVWLNAVWWLSACVVAQCQRGLNAVWWLNASVVAPCRVVAQCQCGGSVPLWWLHACGAMSGAVSAQRQNGPCIFCFFEGRETYAKLTMS